MQLTSSIVSFTIHGADWVIWLLAGLSILSIAVVFERITAFWKARMPTTAVSEFKSRVDSGDLQKARDILQEYEGLEAGVARDGLNFASRGGGPAAEAMAGARTRERVKLERNLAFLGTLGSNAPFIGLFGTVLGIIKAFHDLSENQGGDTSAVMSGISEALIATAIGLLVAIPAVVAFNVFQRRLRVRLAGADELAHFLLATLVPGGSGAADLPAAAAGNHGPEGR